MIKKPGTGTAKASTTTPKPVRRDTVPRSAVGLSAKGAPLIEPSKNLQEKELEISRTIEAMRVKNLQLKSEIEELETEDHPRASRSAAKPLNERQYDTKMQKLIDEKKELEKEMQLIENRIKHILAENESMESEIQSYDMKTRKVLEVKQQKLDWQKELQVGKESQKKQLTDRRSELLDKERQRKQAISQRVSQKSTIEAARSKALAKEKEMQNSIRLKIAELDKVMCEQKQLQVAKMSKSHLTDQSHIDYLKKQERVMELAERTKDQDQRVAEMKQKLEHMKLLEQQVLESKKNTATVKNKLKSRFQDILNCKLNEEQVSRMLEEKEYTKSGVQRNSSYQKMLQQIADNQKKTPKKTSRATSNNGDSSKGSKFNSSSRKSISNLGSASSRPLKKVDQDGPGSKASPTHSRSDRPTTEPSSVQGSNLPQSREKASINSAPKAGHDEPQSVPRGYEEKPPAVSYFETNDPAKVDNKPTGATESPEVPDPQILKASQAMNPRASVNSEREPAEEKVEHEPAEEPSKVAEDAADAGGASEKVPSKTAQDEKGFEETPTLATDDVQNTTGADDVQNTTGADDVQNTTGAEDASIQVETPATEQAEEVNVRGSETEGDVGEKGGSEVQGGESGVEVERESVVVEEEGKGKGVLVEESGNGSEGRNEEEGGSGEKTGEEKDKDKEESGPGTKDTPEEDEELNLEEEPEA